jgi:hypothetical protein
VPEDRALLHLRPSVISNAAAPAVSGYILSNRLAEARSRIPPPTPGTPRNLIDLSNEYNGRWLIRGMTLNLKRGIRGVPSPVAFESSVE